MNALLLTPAQANAIVLANDASDTRKLHPRELVDGRLVLNADILEDPFFTSGPWAETLAAAEPITLADEDLAEPEP